MKNEEISVEDIYLAPEETESSNELEGLDKISAKPVENFPIIEENNKLQKPKRVEEIRKHRQKNLKVFRMNDGTEQAVFYPSDIHAFDEKTHNFEDIKTAITPDENGQHFICSNDKFVAKFSCEEENDDIFDIEQGMYKVTVCARRNSKNKNKGVNPSLNRSIKRDVRVADILTFTNIEPDTDYEYSVEGGGVKEDIVVRKPTEIYRYPFILKCQNLNVQFDERANRVAFVSKESGEEVFFIPAPFMTDANGVTSTDVSYEIRTSESDAVFLTVSADADWMNSPNRAFPVTIDPQIKLSGSNSMTTYSWDNGTLYSPSLHTVGTVATCTGLEDCPTCFSENRMYMSFTMPTLSRNPRIKKAELEVYQHSSFSECCMYPLFGLYQVKDEIYTGTHTPINDTELIDLARMKEGGCDDEKITSYTFDITTLVDKLNKNESNQPKLVLKMLDEFITSQDNITLYGANFGGEYAPKIVITYESSYGVNTSYRTHTHELGRFGQGSVDLQCGNLMFESEDFAWSGNRMPVTVKHLFNSALAGYTYTNNPSIRLTAASFSAMKLGYGFKLNLMQSMISTNFVHEDTSHFGYVYVGENGEETYFKLSDKQVCCDSNSQCYNLYEDVNGGDMVYDPVKLTLKQGEDTYQFDAVGRLIRITDASGNHMDIVYRSERISSVIDGAGREFNFNYNTNAQLTSIVAPDRTNISYTYESNLLTGISYPDGKKAVITYSAGKPTSVTLQDANGAQVYKVAYTFSGDRLESVTEYGSDNAIGAMSTYSYSVASARTLVTTTEPKDEDEAENNVITTTYTFDDDGNIVSEYVYSTDTGNVGGDGEESGINPHAGDGGAGVVSNINNLLKEHSFTSLKEWRGMSGNSSNFSIQRLDNEYSAKFGRYLLYMRSVNAASSENGVYQTSTVLPAGKYTFSAYLRVMSVFSGADAGAFIRVTDTAGNVLGVSEHLTKDDSEYTRLIVPFELDSQQSVQVQILINGKGILYASSPQLENNPYANAYNMLENGNFERGTDGWTSYLGATYSTDTRFNMSRSLMISGNVYSPRNAFQTVNVRKTRSTRETFTLSGWAKGYGLPTHEREGVSSPTFRLRAEVRYYDTYYREYSIENYTADFSPCTEEWQFASVQFAKSKYRTIDNIRVFCEYDYNSGVAYFDDIQLIRNNIETSLSASDFVVESTGTSDDEVEESTDTTPTFSEAKDKYGNSLTETTFTDGEFGTIYRSFAYNADDSESLFDDGGNDLVSETDARGHKTTYTVDGDTSRNEEVTDRLGNKTAYEYDDSGRTTKVISKKADGTEIANVSYAYDTFDNMTEIARGDGMKYALAYNAFHNLESIGIDGKDEPLIKYTYKNGSGRLKEMTYANGDTMKATYNSIGQMVAETWLDKNGVETARYKYVYDGEGNIVRSIDIFAKKEYNYEYEEGKIVRATEADITLSDEIVTAKVVCNTVKYYYDSEGKMTRKVITHVGGDEQTVYYENSDDNTVVKFNVGGRTVTSHSKTDSFGRKVFDELQLGTGFISRQFSYHAGEVTDEHIASEKLKSSPTTQLVSQIILSDGRTIAYEYDAEERITKVTDSVDGVTEYTYDALGQLLTEAVNGKTVNAMVYDNYGNIVQKNGKEYVYDTVWKDLLVGFDGESIEYDTQGNPVSYLGHTLTWEKGRQLKSFDGNTYTYNANGIRTSKTVNGVKHEYTLDGTKILKETWGDNTLIPLYDNEDSVCGIIYNDVPYFFLKNLQGDIIGITNKDGKTVARYTYDAWGVCTIVGGGTTQGNIAAINPFRYRSYYYDQEIGLYYLQSRYYDASVGRFIIGDYNEVILVSNDAITTNNYTYCENNVVNFIDPAGMLSLNSVKNKILEFINKIKNKLKNITESLRIHNSSGYISLPTPPMAIAIDAIIFAISKLSQFTIKTLLKAFVAWAKSNRKSFAKFVKQYLIENFRKILISLISFLARKFSQKYVFEKMKNKISNAIFADSLLFKIYSAFSSLGNIIATLLDIIDGYWDDKLRIKI